MTLTVTVTCGNLCACGGGRTQIFPNLLYKAVVTVLKREHYIAMMHAYSLYTHMQFFFSISVTSFVTRRSMLLFITTVIHVIHITTVIDVAFMR